ncbi:MAG: alpha/beta hydrolase-fold protein [Phenylobacterium sp.]|uniref:alpha/beta hydrolase n=1 Tax=Phenylobacterium sp. TaxID=1871053 RepID=UPI0027279E1A|nr:alpha/beta hydrolase-fold protein [Phenylobacterium sp.]MDO8409969.1 alpha/beta hydrolase-fold protein [Phenylobacterium sp.]
MTVILATAALLVAACAERADAPAPPVADAAPPEGGPYVLAGTQVWTVPDPASGRDYEVFVSLPASYEAEPQRRYPTLYVTDADYGFPILRQIARRVNLDGPALEEFILIGLSYAKGEGGAASRSRDYTPIPCKPESRCGLAHGGGGAYQAYLKDQVLPFIEGRFRADPGARVLLGHSYGGLLGAQILFTDPQMFQAYVLGSPSFWFGQRHIMRMEADYARARTDLPAEVFMYIGGFETPGPTPRHASRYDMVGDMAAMEQALKSRAYPSLSLQSTVLTDEDHLTVAPAGFTRALLAVLPAKP